MPAFKKKGLQSIAFVNPPIISSWASVAGPKEGGGPWAADFDYILSDYMYEEKTWEKCENKMMRETVKLALSKQGLNPEDAELFLAGDLLNQLISSNFAARELNIPFLGLYGACSTMAESMLIGAMMLDGAFYERLVVAAGSHHYTAERQFRFPTEQGVQPVPSAQWTATASGAAVLSSSGNGPRITCATVGRVVDMNQKDPANMGAVMAPAAVDTIKRHLDDMERTADFYDLIVTGDLAQVGMNLAIELFSQKGVCPEPNYSDCGVLLYDGVQGVDSGGSGCGCSACMLCGPLLNNLSTGKIKRLLFVATGALMSPISNFQGESIPGIAHAVAIETV